MLAAELLGLCWRYGIHRCEIINGNFFIAKIFIAFVTRDVVVYRLVGDKLGGEPGLGVSLERYFAKLEIKVVAENVRALFLVRCYVYWFDR